MAKTYSGSAQSEPTAARPTRRATRSQSAEPSEQQEQQTRGGRAKSAEPATGNKRGRKTKERVAELPTVEENAIDEDYEAQTVAQLEAQFNGGDDGHEPSPRRLSHLSAAASAISGTTAKTSFSQAEAEQMDSDVIIDVLPQLASAADNLAKLLAPQGPATPPATWKDIRRTGTKHNKLYNNRIASLTVHKPSFGSREFIQPKHVLSALLGFRLQSMDDVPAAPWRPDNIIFKINLAQMLNSVLTVCDPADWTADATDTLERLEVAFPAGIAGGEFKFEALEFWLDLSCQVTIRRLEACIASEPIFSPHDEIDQVFLNLDGVFKHADALGLDRIDQAQAEQAIKMVDDLRDELKGPFKNANGAGATAANGKLKAKFRWEKFRGHALRYYEARTQELDRRIDNAGGVDRIVQVLSEEAERRANERQAEQMKSSYTKPGSTRRSFKSGMVALKARENQIAQQPSTPAEPTIAPTALPPDENILAYDFGAGEQPDAEMVGLSQVDAQSAAQDGLDALDSFQKVQERNRQKAKARFTDRQPNAARISNNMDEFEDDPRPTQSRPPQSSTKRARAQMEEEPEEDFTPTQDDGFENDHRDHANASQRRQEVSFGKQSARNVTGRVRSSAPARSPSLVHYQVPDDHQPSPAKRQRKNPGSAIPPPSHTYGPDDPAIPKNEFYKQAKVAAKQNRVLNSTQEKPNQIRRPWTDEEESALIELIENHGDDGISYAALKAIDDQMEEIGEARLTRRTAEDLRFKARNMRVTMMLAGRQLPSNWDQVVLGAKEVTKLNQRGVPYTQQRTRASPSRMRDE